MTPDDTSPTSAPDDSAWLADFLTGTTWKNYSALDHTELRDRLSRIEFSTLLNTVEITKASSEHLVIAETYRLWIEVNPNAQPFLYAAWFNLGVELAAAGDKANAITAYSNALVFKADLYYAAINLGLSQESAGQVEAALATWERALQPDEARTMLLNHRGRCLESLGRLEEAEHALYLSLLTDPLQPDVIQHWTHVRQKMCKWPTLAADDIPGLSMDQLVEHAGPLGCLALFDDVDLQCHITDLWLQRKIKPADARLSPVEGYRHDRIRVGYLSSDFRMHAMAFLVAELFELHDRRTFEIFGYCASTDDGSEIRRRMIGAFDHFLSINPLSDQEAAQAIRNDEIDILIDLNGMTAGARIAILRWKPAPVQVTYLGFIGPIALPELDFILCDDYVIPRDIAGSYRPRPLYLPGVYQANDSKRPPLPSLSRGETGLPEDKFVFCCFGNHYKITEEIFQAWMTILKRAENSVLWLIDDSEWSRRNLTAYAKDRGIAEERLIFSPRAEPLSYLARLRLADLYLDTFPYNAGTVASDALRMGLPLVTLSGRSFVSRMAGSLLNAVGLGHLVAHDINHYIDIAAGLASDGERHGACRALLEGPAWHDSIGNVALFTKQLESVFSSIVKSPDRASK